MGTKLVLGLWSLLCVVSLASSKAVVSCKDKGICRDLRIITSNSNEIPSGLTQYRQLAESIDLHGNLMERFFGQDVGTASHLKALNLSYNLLKDDPRGIGNTVQEIDLTYNQLRYVTVPRGVKKFVAVRNKLSRVTFDGSDVEELNLSKNQLDGVPDLKRQSRMVALDLSCNEISEINFDDLPWSLSYLNLANNRIFQTSGGRALNSLQYLDLSSNILTIVDESFNAIPNVQQLYLKNNEIVMFEKSLIFNGLGTIDLVSNDLDCNSVNDFLKKHSRAKLVADERNCKADTRYNLCCIQSSAPYADRVIRYNKRQHEALQNSSMHQQHGPNCANYKPSPCDGDDNKVYEVANAAAYDIQSLVAQDKEALQGILNQQIKLLETKQTEKAQIDNENNQLQTTLNDLTSYIGKLYQDDGFKVPANPAEQLKQIFTKRDGDNKATLEQVNEEERKLQNLQTDIARIEEELQDLGDRKKRLLGDIDARNATVVEHEKKIKELQEKIDKRG
ncbi:leucine-rich repeat-containing protein 4C-like [Culex pipiens pallens]|uniref:leucine-rich repeat-containing protein 4C-like n=1 Tax=Culex pipiens pallens TaxID=42434 RepID=UPI0019542AC2|nr:leucine-rich repeat-containing protein 4C-like [Culex pipiens pallens]